MHEVSLAEGIIEIVGSTATRAGADTVTEVRVEVGELSNVELHALEFAFDSVKKGTVADSARLAIDRTEGAAWCLPCRKEVPLHRFGDACPLCGGFQLAPVRGTEMRVVDIKVKRGGEPDAQSTDGHHD